MPKRGRADARHVDAHEHGALGLLGERADGLAEIGEAQEGEERHRHEDGAAGGDEPRQLDERLADHEGRARVGHPQRPEVALPEHERQVLDEQREAEGEQELVVLGGGAVGLDERLLDARADGEEERRGDEDRRVGVDPVEHEEPVRGVHGEHHHRPVGEVDDAQHAEDQGEPARDEPVDAAEEDAADGGLEQEARGHPITPAASIPSTWRRGRPAWTRRSGRARRPRACRSGPGSAPAWR